MVLVVAQHLSFKVVILVAVQMVNLIHQTDVLGVIVHQLQIANSALLCPTAHYAHLHSILRMDFVAVPQPSIKVVTQTAHARLELFKITIHA